jgi:hypothetical protein
MQIIGNYIPKFALSHGLLARRIAVASTQTGRNQD